MQMAIYTKDNGRMTKLMEMVHILMQTEQLMWVNGRMISSMGRE
jgi:hypothetical protein